MEAFHAFTADRPHWEKWELIDGELTRQASPAKGHQLDNIAFLLGRIRRETGASWLSFAGVGTRVPGDNHNEIIPDVMILPAGGDDLSNWTYEIIVAFEVLSPGSVRRDMVQKRAAYQRMQVLSHYVVVAQDRREVMVFARADGFTRTTLTGDDVLETPMLHVRLPLAEIYREIAVD